MHPGRTELAGHLTKDRLSVAALCVLALAILHPVFGAGFGVIDDHEILSYSSVTQQHPQITMPPDLLRRIFVDEPAIGRLRPLYDTLRMTEVAIFGDNPTGWHTMRVVLGALAASLLYRTGRRVGMSIVPSLLLGAWLLVTPGVSSVWIGLGPAETYATLFLVTSGWAATHAAEDPSPRWWDWLFVAGGVASALSKESFILALPAVVGFRWFLIYLRPGPGPARVRRALGPTALLLTVGLALLAVTYVVARAAGEASYGGQRLLTSSHNFSSYLTYNALILFALGGAPSLFVLCGFALQAKRGLLPRRILVLWLAVLALVGLLAIPQLLLYSRNGDLEGRYLLPVGLAAAVGVAAGLAWLQSARLRSFWSVAVLSWLVILSQSGVTTWLDATNANAGSAKLKEMTSYLATTLPEGSGLIIAGDSGKNYEEAISMKYHIAHTGRSDIKMYFLPTEVGKEVDNQIKSWLWEHFSNNIVGISATCRDLTTVVVLFESSRLEACDWYPRANSIEFTELTLRGDLLPSVAPMGIRLERAGYTVLVRPGVTQVEPDAAFQDHETP